MQQSASQVLVERVVDQQDSEQRDLDHQPLGELEQSLLTLNANLSASTYRFLVLLRTFDQRGGWHGWGVRTMAHWLGWKCGIALASAREQLRVALRRRRHVGTACSIDAR